MFGRPSLQDPAITPWEENAQAWTQAVRTNQIASRVAVTNNAILASIAARTPRRILDIGCGEGWLCRAVKHHIGSAITGLDGSQYLIKAARKADPHGDYDLALYEDLIAGSWPEGCWEATFDALVFNFALFQKDLKPLLAAAKTRLAPKGAILIQTLSAEILGDEPAGWRHERFEGFGKAAWTGLDWYCHDIAALTDMIDAVGLTAAQIIRTKARDPNDLRERSVIIVAVQD